MSLLDMYNSIKNNTGYPKVFVISSSKRHLFDDIKSGKVTDLNIKPEQIDIVDGVYYFNNIKIKWIQKL